MFYHDVQQIQKKIITWVIVQILELGRLGCAHSHLVILHTLICMNLDCCILCNAMTPFKDHDLSWQHWNQNFKLWIFFSPKCSQQISQFFQALTHLKCKLEKYFNLNSMIFAFKKKDSTKYLCSCQISILGEAYTKSIATNQTAQLETII